MIVGEMSYKLSLLLEKNNLEVTQQPYNLQMAEADSKLVLSMSLNVSTKDFFMCDLMDTQTYQSNETTCFDRF